MTYRKLGLYLAIAIIAAGLTACGAPAAEPAATLPPTEAAPPTPPPTQPAATEEVGAPTLEGTAWQLFSYVNESGGTVHFLPLAPGTAVFEDGTVAGTTGCNQYSAAYQSDGGNKLSIGEITLTRMACDEQVNAQEAAFVAALEAAESYQIEAGELTLIDGTGREVLIFVARHPLPLVGTNWILEALVDAQGGLSPTVEGVQTTAVFDTTGNVGGMGGCNVYSSTYEVAGENLTISPGVRTEVFCTEPAGVMDQENAFLAAMERVSTYQIRGETLQLHDNQGRVLATFSAARVLPLVGTTWQLTSLGAGGDAVSSTIAGTTVTALFDDSGTVAGFSGCNQYSAQYTADESAMTLTVEQPVATLMACEEPAGVMDQEADFLRALEQVASYELRDYRLVLRDAAGNFLAQFEPQLLR